MSSAIPPNPDSQAAAASNPAPASAEAPTEPQAQAATGLTRDDVKSMLSEFRNGIFADFRKAGGFEKPSKTKSDDSATPATAAQPDPIKLRALDRSLTKAGLATELSQSQYERAERAFATEAPEDVDGWVKDYFAGWKGPQPVQPPTQAQPAPAPKPLNALPASDRGGTVPAAVPLAEADLVTMSESDRAALIREKGLGWFRAQLMKQVKGRRVTF